MKGKRLEGAALRLAANLAGTAAGRFFLRKQVEGVFGLDRLMSLPTVARMPLDNLPQVVAGAPPPKLGQRRLRCSCTAQPPGHQRNRSHVRVGREHANRAP